MKRYDVEFDGVAVVKASNPDEARMIMTQFVKRAIPYIEEITCHIKELAVRK
jgi:hypothetical protein